MASVEERLTKLREDRIAREKARIEKLRQLNIKKYTKPEEPAQRPLTSKPKNSASIDIKSQPKPPLKNNFHVNGTTKRPLTVPLPKKTVSNNVKPKSFIPTATKTCVTANGDGDSLTVRQSKKSTSTIKPPSNIAAKKDAPKNDPKFMRKSIAPKCNVTKTTDLRKSLQQSMLAKSLSQANPRENSRESVFERLYKPKVIAKKELDPVKKIHSDPNYLKKIIKNSGLITNKRLTVFEPQNKPPAQVRRSISAVHLKRISKSELSNCFHKWGSVGNKLDKVHLEEINEDENVKDDKLVSAVKSERKQVKFRTPIAFNFNTPRPEELQSRLKNWLQKRGKSLDSYHHLQCFGLHQQSTQKIKPLQLSTPGRETPRQPLQEKKQDFDEENKENIEMDSDSDNDSYVDVMNDTQEDFKEVQDLKNWRQVSIASDSTDLNDTPNTTLTSADSATQITELVIGALTDLTDILHEGYDWSQCARWLRAIRDRYPSAPLCPAYWQCRAVLEEKRGDLPASLHCWEEAIATGTQRSVVESNLDQLLDKFMQLKISPNSVKDRPVNPKLVDVKNVFKSTLIRFAVQKAKLRRSSVPAHQYTVTPVRRSGRLSMRPALTECRVTATLPPLDGAAFRHNPSLQTP